MAARELAANEHAILGILRARGPLHGYEMVRAIAQELSDVCPMEQSTLYTYLRGLEARGLVAWHEERVNPHPPRKVFDLTPEGRDAIDAWLTLPVGRLREVRLDFLLKVYFLGLIDEAAERRLITAQVAACEAYLARLTARETVSRFGRMVVDSKRTAAEATLAWLRTCAAELDTEVPV